MRAFDVYVNGKQLCVAGIGKNGVLNAVLNHITGRGRDEIHLRVGGLDSTTEEHVNWTSFVQLAVGDEVLIKIIETDAVDKPQEREQKLFTRLL